MYNHNNLADQLSFRSFYNHWDGHDSKHLQLLLQSLKRELQCANNGKGPNVIFLAGDSSLDNKYWFEEKAGAINGYEFILKPSQMKMDIAYWVNAECVNRNCDMVCVNAAVEATSLNSRAVGVLLPQGNCFKF